MSIKVIGAGLGRTGTKSLQAALAQLGFGKCYHMEDLLLNPSQLKHWKNADRGVAVDWESLFRGYQSVVDYPGAFYYQALADYYPNAKIVLSVRDPLKWYESCYSTIFQFDPGFSIKLKLLAALFYSATARDLLRVVLFNERTIWKQFFEGKFKDQNYAIQKFNQHIEEVKKVIPSERLLIFRATDGWAPLCQFLGTDIPTTPYPRSNKKEDFANRAKRIIREVLASTN